MAIANVLHPPGILASNTVFSIPSPAESPRATRQEDDDMGHEGLRAEEDDAGDDLGAHGSLVMREKTCPTCGRVFKKQSRLTQHLLTHGDDRPFACPVPGCGKAYKRQEHLKNHATSHGSTDEERKPYVCEHEGCTAAFSNPHHLKRHEKAHAEGGIYKVCTK